MKERWKWLFQPLSRAMRSQLEIAFSVVVTGAVIVGLSTLIRPDPSKLAAMMVVSPIAGDELREEARLRAVPPPAPKVALEFAAAVASGDLVAMERLHTPGMALDGMLSVAAESGEPIVARWLLDRGADVHEDESSLDAPVLLADAHPDLVALLLDRGAAEPSLATAAQAGAKGAVLRLLAAHASVNAADPSPLYAAVSSTRATAENKRFIVDKLLVAGADPNRDDGQNALPAAVRACDVPSEERAPPNDCLTIIKLLAKRGARARGEALVAALSVDESVRDATLDAVLTARLERGATAVALAQVWNPDPRVIKLLVSKQVDWAWHDGEDDAALPLLAAVQRGDRDYARALLDAGAPADVHFKDGTCALGEAINGVSTGGNTNEYARIVELLVARGVDVNRRLPDGRTPLFAAAESGDLRVIKALLDRGARVNEPVLDDSALDAAEQSGHQPAARVLHAHGARRVRKNSSAKGD